MNTRALACLVALVALPAAAAPDLCWRESKTRGAGTIPDACTGGLEFDESTPSEPAPPLWKDLTVASAVAVVLWAAAAIVFG